MSLEKAKASLEAKIGDVVNTSDWLEVGQERINQFADATGDHQWIHIDVERAKAESPMGTTIAHGFLTLSLIPYLTGLAEGGGDKYEGLKMGLNYGLNKVRFITPVPAGAKVRGVSRLKAVEEKGGSLQVLNEVTIELQGSSKPACVAETLSRLYFEN